MLFGLDGIEIGIIILFLTLFAGILSGFPVAFAISGAAVMSFAIIAALDSSGLLVHAGVDMRSDAYRALIAEGVRPDTISVFRYPDLPRFEAPLFPQGWETALDRNIGFMVNRINEKVLAGNSIEILLAVLMFVMMGIVLERSRIADELLTTMARVFGPLPGGLAVSIVIVGAFLAASTGIVGATVVTMGLLALPTMLKNGYSPQLATGVIAASGTLGQIIPPSIVIVLLGTLAGDLYATAQEQRAQLAGCNDALTYLGKPAVVSVGALFQAALLPGIMLAVLYALYAFVFALLNPTKAPAVQFSAGTGTKTGSRNDKLTWFLAVPVGIIGLVIGLNGAGVVGSQSVLVGSFTDAGQSASLRTRVSPACADSMIALHGQAAWDSALAEQAQIDAAGGVTQARQLSPEERAERVAQRAVDAPPIGTGIAVAAVIMGLMLAVARGVAPLANHRPLLIGAGGIGLLLLVDVLLVSPLTTPGGAILLAAYRKRKDQGLSPRIVLLTAGAIIVMLLVGYNFDMRMGREVVPLEDRIAFLVAFGAFLYAMFGLLWACWVLLAGGVLAPVVRETAKVTAMVFAILIGSQLLNLVLISFGGEHYIQQFLRSFDNEWQVFLLVMLVLFILGFVLDFLEIIYIVIPIVGPVIYGGTFDPKWVTIMIAVNLQTSFLTPPFGFALFYLRGVAPKSITTGQIYRGVLPFIGIQIGALLILAFFPWVVTILPNLLG
ncbi:TRAP transporter large permease [Yoonia sp. TsM2_T14_4]|uniref:TRAP transporter large permease n=1 Tax=Yoonia sp. TsM2_T14_4 TaxID=3415141 RepID=UPI003C7300CC